MTGFITRAVANTAIALAASFLITMVIINWVTGCGEVTRNIYDEQLSGVCVYPTDIIFGMTTHQTTSGE